MPSPFSSSPNHQYRGRFAPSPSGPLHFGSLVTAVGSYFQAKSQQGKWLLRIDDIDPPRQPPGAVEQILAALEAHGLQWDESIHYQSQQSQRYESVLSWLQEQGRLYACECSRKQIKQAGDSYLGTCREKGLSSQGNAIRFLNLEQSDSITDKVRGKVTIPMRFAQEDFILKRKDGLYAYHLAAVVDDIQQGITEIVRGADLLHPSICQTALYKALGRESPQFLHLPLAVSEPGRKLSKQNHASALCNHSAVKNLYSVLIFLGLTPPSDLLTASCSELLKWGLENWQLPLVEGVEERIVADEFV